MRCRTAKSSKVCFDYTDFIEAEFGSYAMGDRSIEKRLKDPRLNRLNKRALSHPSLRNCPYCNGELLTIVKDGPVPLNTSTIRPEHLVKKCSVCGWWFYDYCLWGYLHDFYCWNYYEGVLRKFDISAISLPLQILRRHLAKRFEDIHSIHPRKFEELCQDIFRDWLDCEVKLTSYSKDGGVDLYAIDGETKFAIQLKRRANDVSEGIQAIRAFLGAMVINGEINGIFCTTANRFSDYVKRAVFSPPLRKYGIRIELIDYKKLRDIFGFVAKNRRDPWDELLTRNYYRTQ